MAEPLETHLLAGAQALWQEARALYAAIRVTEGVRECDEHLEASACR